MNEKQQEVHDILLAEIKENRALAQRNAAISNYIGFVQAVVGLAQAKLYIERADGKRLENSRVEQASPRYKNVAKD